ncbi:MAG: hypothetical protein AB2385_00065 [Symbiobacterium sp.]|uniref:hypothetical protein n=1 Tax=Symbiobacterium sp. TaxID=1971213 RepID=UPI0034644FC5
MDRHADLRAAYDEALAAGAELLDLLRAPAAEAPAERIQQLVDRRDAAVRAAVALFRPGDQEALRDVLEALVAQQRALEDALDRAMGELRRRLQEVEAVKATARRSRQVMDAGRRGRLLDQRR